MIFLVLLGAAIAYNLIVIWAAESWRRVPQSVAQDLPPVSIFKPLCGADPWLYDCLASFCRLDYPEYELLCCTARPDDPAADVVRRLQKDFPRVQIRLLVAQQHHGANAKVDNLDQMYREMKYDTLVISDDDIVVEPDYLRRLAAEFGDGVLSCPYRGRSGGTFASTMEALGIAGEFCGNAFVARKLEGVRFALGSSMALSKSRVAEIGGFPAIAAYLADDYELGARVAALGHVNRLSRVVVDTQLPPDTWASMLAHQFRWMRTQAVARPGGHLGLGLTYGSLWTLGALVWHPRSLFAAWLILIWAASRCLACWCVGVRALDDPVVRRWWWLAPLRELLTASLWIASLFRRTVTWRGERYRTVGGKMIR